MPGTTRRAPAAKSPAFDGAEDDASMGLDPPTREEIEAQAADDDAAEATEIVSPSVPDVQQAVLDVLSGLGLTAADLATLAEAKRAKVNHDEIDLNGGTFPERIAAHRARAKQVQDEDPDLAAKLLDTARALQGEHKLAVKRGDKYQAHADICDLCHPDGWPFGSDHASCAHGEYDR